MALEFTTSYLADSLVVFRHYKLLAEKAIAQVTDEQLLAVTDPEANSIAIIVKHMAGNMRSRWVGFPEADGEKPDRQRDTEFEAPPETRAALLALWEQGWNYLFAALEPLTEADMACTTTIRGERHSILQAINRQIAHYAYHCGQIVFLARQLRGEGWQSLSVARGKSEEFNRRVQTGEASQR
ncbi:MAG TPA: DUF1572 family protein [Acidobacteriaceae bacterium]|nr:DUF1572 family protein [Acidobacteriaceae bacterium]